MNRLYSLERGFAAIAAVFLVVVMAALGAFMLSISNTQQLNSAADMQGTRAYWAARAGAEWEIAAIRAALACPAAATLPAAIEGFTMILTCASSTYSENGAPVTIYTIGSTAQSGGAVGGVGFVERSVSVQLE